MQYETYEVDASASHAPYEPEVSFYATVASGDVEKVGILCKEPLSQKQGLGILSRNRITSLKYHLVITASMIARQCIQHGMDMEDAYGLSDFYIGQLDACSTASEIDEVHHALALDYANRMKGLRTIQLHSAPVARAVDYIQSNIQTRLTLDGIAHRINISASYLSRLFHAETGMTIGAYIAKCKVGAAKRILETTALSMLDIATLLSFCSQSHFTQVFRQECGMSPSKYRKAKIRHRTI